MKSNIPFNRPYLTGKEIDNILKAHQLGQLAGDGYFTAYCQKKLENIIGVNKVFLTHSCTAALEIAALCLDLEPEDEIIMPSYTFVSTANAFVLRGAKPVFIDIDKKTLNLDVSLLEQNITSRTKAIVVVHYAGISCDMDKVMQISRDYNIPVIEDAAQAIYALYKDRPLGSFGDFSTFSFHETKNIISGEGGALIINNPDFIEKAEIIREKGTNRSNFLKGFADKYTWVGQGSSYLPGELISAFLAAQLDYIEQISKARMKVWQIYMNALNDQSDQYSVPYVPNYSRHNAHIFYLLVKGGKLNRDLFIKYMKDNKISAPFHYIPLHSAPYSKELGLSIRSLPNTDIIADSIVRLPMWVGLADQQQSVIEAVISYFGQ